jgi:competence protein ComFB
MEFFNLIEMIVKDIVDEVLAKEDDFKSIKYHRNDIIAYVLNRVPPRYVTGERGIIHSRIDPRLKYQQHTDILFLTYEAIGLFSKRRTTEIEEKSGEIEKLSGLIPHMIGEALEETTLSVIPDLKVTLLYNDKPAAMMDLGWKNPYTAAKATRGYFHFWPRYIQGTMSSGDHVEFILTFEHPKFEARSVKVRAKVNKKNDLGNTQSIPLILLKLKGGVTSEFLCED